MRIQCPMRGCSPRRYPHGAGDITPFVGSVHCRVFNSIPGIRPAVSPGGRITRGETPGVSDSTDPRRLRPMTI